MKVGESILTTIGTRLVLMVLVVATIGCDRVTKHIAATTLAGTAAQSFLADSVRLEYAENTGGFLSLGAGLPVAARTTLFTVVTGLALLAMIAVAIRRRDRVWSRLGISLFITGGASNWLDRVMAGRVIDFINVGFGPLRTGIFNVADLAILCGVGLLVLAEVGRPNAPTSPPNRPR